MSVITEAHDAIAHGVEAVKAWVTDVEQKLPAAVDEAAKLQASPIVQALEGILLPPSVETAIANLIREAAALAAEHGDVTVTASATPPAAATTTPAEATPATDTPAV